MPSKTMRPRSGLVKPATISKQVVLPAPLGPMTPRISPGATSKLTWSTATTPPKRRDTLSTVRIGPRRRGSSGRRAATSPSSRGRSCSGDDAWPLWSTHAVPLAQRVDAVPAGEPVVQQVAAADQDPAEAVGQEDHHEQPADGERGLADHAHADEGRADRRSAARR